MSFYDSLNFFWCVDFFWYPAYPAVANIEGVRAKTLSIAPAGQSVFHVRSPVSSMFKHHFSNSSGSLYTRFASACAVEVDLTTNQWFACVHPPTEPTQNLIGWLFEYSAVLSIFHFQDVCGEWRSLLGRFVAGLPWNVQSAVLRILCKFAPANPLWLRSEAPLLDGSASLRWRSLFRAPHVGWPRDTTVWRQKTNIELSSVRNYW